MNYRNLIRHTYQGANGENAREYEDTPENRQSAFNARNELGGKLELIDYTVLLKKENEILLDPETGLAYSFSQADDADAALIPIVDQAVNDERNKYSIANVKTISAIQPEGFGEL